MNMQVKIIGSLLILLSLACSEIGRKQSGISVDTRNMTIIMPDSVELYPKDAYRPDSNKKAKLFTLIDVSCSTCLIKMGQLNQLYTEIKKENRDVGFIPICYAADNFEMLKYLIETSKIDRVSVPLVLDVSNNFINLNEGIIDGLVVTTVLTDENNNVILAGDPLGSERDRIELLAILKSYTR